MLIQGFYNENSYWIDTVDELGVSETVYDAANSLFDSQTASNTGVGSDKIKKFCEQTAREYTEELNATYAGIEYKSLSDF